MSTAPMNHTPTSLFSMLSRLKTIRFNYGSRQSQLTNLNTFGFVRVGYDPVLPLLKDMTEIAALIVHSTSQTLHKVIRSDQMGGMQTAVAVETPT